VHDVAYLRLELSLVLKRVEKSGIALKEISPESFYILAPRDLVQTEFVLQAAIRRRESFLETMHCLRCNRAIEPGDKSVALYMFAQTVGIKPRQKSTAQRISFCPQCSVSLAMGPPPEGALNIAAWDMIRDLVGSDPSLNQAAWQNLSGVLELLPATGTDGRPRAEQAVGYFEF
jgi:hypothetical protein